MSRLCRVSVKDLDDVEHTVTVTASSLYEAVARGLAEIKKHEWVADIASGLNMITVELCEASVTHRVMMNGFQKWLNTGGRSPREMMERKRIRAILEG
jgi:hypothetical protein